LKGLLVAGVLAASMSTISSVLNSLATVTMSDILPGLARHRLPLRNARWLSLGFGVVTTGLACFAGQFGNILDASNRIINLFGGSLVGVFLLGIVSTRANATGAFWGLLIGLAGAIALQVFTPVSFMWYSVSSAALAIGSGLLISRLVAAPPSPPAAGAIELQSARSNESDRSISI
jgi:Na+/proline symporter